MSDLHDRLERDLLHIADRATPSPNAWEAIQHRISEQADQPELEITMLKPNPDPGHPWRNRVLAAAAATALVIVGLFAIFSGDSNETETIDTPPTTVPATTTTAAPGTTEPPAADGDASADLNLAVVLEFMDRVLPGMEGELSKEMGRFLKKKKVPVHLGAKAKSYKKGKSGLVVDVEIGGKTEQFECDVILSTVGRRSNATPSFSRLTRPPC